MGLSRDPSSIFTLLFPFVDIGVGEGPEAVAEAEESAGRGRVAVESAAETEAEGARMLIFLDLGFLFDGLQEDMRVSTCGWRRRRLYETEGWK